ncbi:hypothetical protein BDFB_014194, partial [Asbolus verrucosus]
MCPEVLNVIYSSLNDLNIHYGFPSGARPYFYHEVPDPGNEAISKYEYIGLGEVLEFMSSANLGEVFSRNDKLAYLVNWGAEWSHAMHMVEFRNVVEGTKVKNWWSNNDQQIAFSRSMGFVAFTSWGDLNENLYTNLPWNLLSCTRKTLTVDDEGYAIIYLGTNEYDEV